MSVLSNKPKEGVVKKRTPKDNDLDGLSIWNKGSIVTCEEEIRSILNKLLHDSYCFSFIYPNFCSHP